jgi:Tfp pilus assembly protein PilO
MKISRRETLLGVITLTAILFGLTYWLAGSRIEKQRHMKDDKIRLLRQIELNKRILSEKDQWYSRLEELQNQLPIYDDNISITAELLKLIKRTADQYGLDLVRTQPYREEQTGTLYELGVSCNWEGPLDALVHFLYDLQKQGVRFDVLQLNAQPDAQRDRILKGSMIIDCAYRKGKPEPNNKQYPTNNIPSLNGD